MSTQTLPLNPHGWHPGETAAHALLKVPTSSHHNPTSPGLSPSHGYRVASSSLLALGTLNSKGQIWTTLLGSGEKGFARPVARNILAVQSLVDREFDPFVEALLELGSEDGGVYRPAEEGGKIMSGLSIDLETRDRVKLAGRLLVASLADLGGGEMIGGRAVAEVQLAMKVEEALGNCPKYINRRDVMAHVPSPVLVAVEGGGGGKGGEGGLHPRAVELIDKADMLFLSTTNGVTMDTNHRGGSRGFIRILKNEGGEMVVVYPEYSGNQLYQSLGNLLLDSRVGVVIPDYDTGDVLYLSGDTEVIVGSDAGKLMPHARVVVKIIVKEARFVQDGLAFRGVAVEPSPYNPPVKRLAREGPARADGIGEEKPAGMVTLVKREILSKGIGRFTFKLQAGKSLQAWKPGQHVTLDFGGELDHGWSHMREDDPQSLNDDFVRTFTVSNSLKEGEVEVGKGTELEITVRRHGPATGLLWSRKSGGAKLEIPVLGFGGEESFRIPRTGRGKKAVFVAGGVGITPLLAQAPGLLKGGVEFSLLWTLRGEDVGLAVDTFERIPGLAQRTELFITGGGTEVEQAESLQGLGVNAVSKRRVLRDDVLGAREDGRGTRYYLCASPGMQKIVEGWLEGEDFASESFNY